ncbi:hypothetical protein ABZW96_31140 [Nocardia sp. NPDC004168]|uniref:hypothetical protein n=1 Tax=Nocardia sp. NPDC004168 TaxID=3154452 RepID=UPI0033B0AD12
MAVSTRRPPLRAATMAALLALTAAAGCSSADTSPTPATTSAASGRQPVATTDADWKPVTDTFGRTGKFGDNNTAYRIPLVRTALQVTTAGVLSFFSVPHGCDLHIPGESWWVAAQYVA